MSMVRLTDMKQKALDSEVSQLQPKVQVLKTSPRVKIVRTTNKVRPETYSGIGFRKPRERAL